MRHKSAAARQNFNTNRNIGRKINDLFLKNAVPAAKGVMDLHGTIQKGLRYGAALVLAMALCATAALAGHVRELPYIADTNGTAGRQQYKA